jgi:hypothetical protein
MIEKQTPTPLAGVPTQRTAPQAETRTVEDHRPRYLRWLLPTSCASAVPLGHMEEARMKFIAYH